MYNSEIINKYIRKGATYIDRKSQYKFVTIYEEELKNNEVLTIYPLWAGLKVTSNCNCECIHCWVDKKEYTPKLEEIKLALNKLKKMQVMHVTVTGGEPFIRNDILNIIEEVKKNRFHLEIFTNATLLNEEVVKEMSKIIDKENDLIQISFDAASEEIWKKQRVKGDYKKVIQNIKLLVKYNFKVRLNFTATHINQGDIVKSFILAQKLGVSVFSISHVYDLNNGKKLYELVDNDIFEREIEQCLKISQNSKTEFRVFIPIEYYSLNAEIVDKRNDILIKQYSQQWFIHSDGNIYPDVTLETEEFCLGNIYISMRLKL